MHRRKRHLPHFERAGASYFITFTLTRGTGVNLTGASVAPIIIGALHHFHGDRYWLYDYTVMPDHVHCILQPIVADGVAHSLERIMHSIKSWTSNQINRTVGRTGALWQGESCDHIVRGERDHREKARYIFNNSAAKGLVDDPADWPWWGNAANESE